MLILSRVKVQFNDIESLEKQKIINENGLETLLIKLLDIENDEIIVNEIHDILNSMLTASLCQQNLLQWISLCKETATASFGKFNYYFFLL